MTQAEVIDKEMCRRWPHHFAFKRCLTKDEHDSENPVKPLPDLPYLRAYFDCLLVSGKIIKPDDAVYAVEEFDREWIQALYDTGMFFCEKSRQVMATWLACIYIVWRAKFRPHQLILAQSKREDDAANLVCVSGKEPQLARCSFIEMHMPPHLKSIDFPKGGNYCHLYWPNGSHIWAIPEGGEIIRSNTPSVVVSDEAAFQPEFDKSFTAAIPCVNGGGNYVAFTSAEPGCFQDLVEAA